MPRESQTTRLLCVAFIGGLGAAVGLVLMALATGSTFGQRCERAFPANGLAQERCVDNLAHGRPM